MQSKVEYETEYEKFKWADVEQYLGWQSSSRVNIAHEILDRMVLERDLGDKIALSYSDNLCDKTYSFSELMKLSNKFANVLVGQQVKKGDRVFIFMPRMPELYISLFGILKIGAVAGLLFEAFMEEALLERLKDGEAVAVITTPDLKSRIPVDKLPKLKKIITVDPNRDISNGDVNWFHEMEKVSDEFEVRMVGREDPAFILYTSGSTGKPKGVVHAHNDMLGYYATGKYVLDLRPDDIYWCTADPGWITGLAYGVFAPLSNGIGTIILGGRFSPSGWYSVLEKYRVSVWYSAPTAFRMLMSAGTEPLTGRDLSCLRHILSVGEPLNPEVVRWGRKEFGIDICDTWFMTETGMQMISNFPNMKIKLGSMGRPVPGIEAAILDDDGNKLPPLSIGNLAIKSGWPNEMRAIWNDTKKFSEYYLHGKWFLSGDLAYTDKDGYFYFQGRSDDIINTAGERVGPFEIESRLLEHPAVVEAGVIGKPDPIRGEIIKAFVVIRSGYKWSDDLEEELSGFVKLGLAAHAAPREFAVKKSLPKTRSGKILRRALRLDELRALARDSSLAEQDRELIPNRHGPVGGDATDDQTKEPLRHHDYTSGDKHL